MPSNVPFDVAQRSSKTVLKLPPYAERLPKSLPLRWRLWNFFSFSVMSLG